MSVKDGLSGTGTTVEHDPKPLVAVLLQGDIARLAQHVAGNLGLGSGQRGSVGVVHLGDHQTVHGCLRVDVAKRKGRLGLLDDRRWHLALHDLAEQAVGFRFP